ncbi:uncharacterized protein LOC134176918 [Corticium candelabrum]|uniref:uncharacterized protein LOC134176918 n=1 Tax=Corticium candelabrum TaxID=121492 RepID=UPI002E262FC7|nr:uncharacterized protein LOC134176918 [Corticium candelabrum]
MGDEASAGESTEAVERQEADDELNNRGSNSEDVNLGVSLENDERNRRRKRKTSQPQRYRPQSSEEEIPVEKNLYIVVGSEEATSLARSECKEEKVDTGKRSECLKETRAEFETKDETSNESEECVGGAGGGREQEVVASEGDTQLSLEHHLTNMRGLVYTDDVQTPSVVRKEGGSTSTTENGRRNANDLKPWESSTLPRTPVFPYRVHAPIYVPERVSEPVYNYVRANVTDRDREIPSLLQPDVKTCENLETERIRLSQWVSPSPVVTSSGFTVETAAVTNTVTAGRVYLPLAKTGAVVITAYPNVITTYPNVITTYPKVIATYPSTAIQSPSVIQSSKPKRRSTKEYMRAKRADPNFRAAEVKSTRERMQRARQDPAFREKERARHREQQRARRLDPGYAARIREKRKERHQKARQQPDYRLRERERQREYMRAKRANPEYRKKERELKRQKKRRLSDDGDLKESSPNENVHVRSSTEPISGTDSDDSVSQSKVYWSGRENRSEWMVTSPTNHLISNFSDSTNHDSSLSTQPEVRQDSNLDAFGSSASINYVRYDDGRDASGGQIGSNSSSTITSSRSDSSVVFTSTCSPYFRKANDSSPQEQKIETNGEDEQTRCETNGNDMIKDERIGCDSVSSMRNEEHDATKSELETHSLTPPNSGANIDA